MEPPSKGNRLEEYGGREFERGLSREIREEQQVEWMPRYLPREEFVLDLLASPFLKEIMNRPKPEGFKCLTLIPYKGTEDLINYVLNFQTLMVLHIDKDHILCKTFATILRGFAFTSFTNLPSHSI